MATNEDSIEMVILALTTELADKKRRWNMMLDDIVCLNKDDYRYEGTMMQWKETNASIADIIAIIHEIHASKDEEIDITGRLATVLSDIMARHKK